MRKITYLLLCLLLGIGLVSAQTRRVTGVVISADDGQPIIGASVVVKGATATGTATNVDGRFELNVPSNATHLVVSYIGMVAQEVAISQSMRIVLLSDNQQLDEVVVTAMGISREKKSLGYAAQEIKSGEITQAGQQNVLTSLSGKIAGIQITSQGGQIGTSQNIVIRGNSSFGSNQPLFVVDGVPVTNDNSTAATINLGSGLNDLNPNDIESISVLKGGAAALYGMRAGNGVILITTKSGQRNRGVVVTYDGEYMVDQVYGLPPFQNKYGQGNNGAEWDYKKKQAAGYTGSYQDFARQYGFSYVDGAGSGIMDDVDESWGPRLDIGLMIPQFDSPVVNGERQATPWVSHPNNVKDFFVNGYTTGHTISFSSSSDNSTTRASIGYRGQTGTTPNTNLDRYSASINNKYMVNKFFDFDISLNYIRTTSSNLPGTGYAASNPAQSILQWFGRQVNMQSLKDNWDQKDAEGNYTMYNWNTAYHANPYYVAYTNTTTYKRDRTFGKASLWYKPTEYLKFEGRVGMDYFGSDQLSRREDPETPDGWFRDINRHTMEINADLIGYFNKSFGDFNINALAGANYRDYDNASKTIGGNRLIVKRLYTVTNVNGNPIAEESHSLRRSNSVYANASFGWKNQIYVDASARNDWDSTIKDAFFYPSISGSWILSETLPSLTANSVLSYLKLRGGWAKIGNATVPYRSGAYYSAEATPMKGTVLFSNPTSYPPTGLRPEMVKTWEFGIEASFLQNRVHLDAAYYSRITSDQIMTANIATSTGYQYMVINAGKISNKGIEIQLSADILKNSGGLNWTATLNWAKDRSKVDELYPGLNAYQLGASWSVTNLAIPGKSWGTLRGTGFVYNDDGSIQVKNGFPVYTTNQIIGDVTPKWLGGLRNEFAYKNLSLGFLLDMRWGGDIFSLSQSFGTYTGIYSYTAAGDLRENGVILGKNYMTDKVFKTSDGKINDVTVNAQDFFRYYYNCRQLAIIDGSYLKLREAYITYTFPKALLAKTKYINGARLSLVGSNVALLWTHKSNLIGLDPESTTGSGNDGVGFESNTYPPARSIGLKLGLTF